MTVREDEEAMSYIRSVSQSEAVAPGGWRGLLLLLFAALFAAGCTPLPLAAPAATICPQPAVAIDPAWLEERATLAQLEFALCDDLTALRRVHACLRPGDEIWTFATPPETWKAGAGRAGFAILRDGAIVGGVLRCAE
ncbi:MAG TPA: hypothetical protein P5333_21350 [Caldilinea sp.]|nr:hypothetical protein [Caldilinea sp.]